MLSQNYPYLEYIIIDGGSTDNTIDIIKKYEKHLTYWETNPDRGQSHAINKGFKYCTGDLVNWINSDDWYEIGAFEKIANSYLDHPEKLVYAFKERVVDINGVYIKNNQTPRFNNLGDAIFYCELDQPSTFFQRSVWQDLFPLNENLHYIMDGDLWIRFLLKYTFNDVHFIDLEIVNFRLHEDSKSIKTKINNGFLKERSGLVKSVLNSCIVSDDIINKILEYYFDSVECISVPADWELSNSQKREILGNIIKRTIITALGKADYQTAKKMSFLLLKNLMFLPFAFNSLRKTITNKL